MVDFRAESCQNCYLRRQPEEFFVANVVVHAPLAQQTQRHAAVLDKGEEEVLMPITNTRGSTWSDVNEGNLTSAVQELVSAGGGGTVWIKGTLHLTQSLGLSNGVCLDFCGHVVTASLYQDVFVAKDCERSAVKNVRVVLPVGYANVVIRIMGAEAPCRYNLFEDVHMGAATGTNNPHDLQVTPAHVGIQLTSTNAVVGYNTFSRISMSRPGRAIYIATGKVPWQVVEANFFTHIYADGFVEFMQLMVNGPFPTVRYNLFHHVVGNTQGYSKKAITISGLHNHFDHVGAVHWEKANNGYSPGPEWNVLQGAYDTWICAHTFVSGSIPNGSRTVIVAPRGVSNLEDCAEHSPSDNVPIFGKSGRVTRQGLS